MGDSTENECVQEVPGYPHLVLYPAVRGGERPKLREKIVYTGRQDVQTFLDFLEENARNLEDVDPKLLMDARAAMHNIHARSTENKRVSSEEHKESTSHSGAASPSQCSSTGQKCTSSI